MASSRSPTPSYFSISPAAAAVFGASTERCTATDSRPTRGVTNRGTPRSHREVDELDVKDEGARGSTGARRLVAVGEIAGDPEACLFAFGHELDALGPSLDDRGQIEA